ncbi:hypothetical protein HPP92_022140 [Vanilla planifolia]|uniref:Uncharacterized protein n=1 Tax=Vanilla planifolia TaxID=51239 RepID=A0A835Q001_VANPL|nr:hypothetical protein HPP92_022140 [Vanilla planifolia]
MAPSQAAFVESKGNHGEGILRLRKGCSTSLEDEGAWWVISASADHLMELMEMAHGVDNVKDRTVEEIAWQCK